MLVFDEHERQYDIVQHMHAFRLYLEPCLSFLDNTVCPVKSSDCGLLSVGGDQPRHQRQVFMGGKQEPTLG